MKHGSAIVACKCENKFQDATYGTGQRVAAATAKQDEKGGWVDVRCTVCSQVHRAPIAAVR